MFIVDWKSVSTLLLSLALVACGDEHAPEQERSSTLDARGALIAASLQAANDSESEQYPGLVVQLAFGPEADLDLYVTDPLLETVYFANKKGRSGGQIKEDLRCDSPPQGAEEIHIEEVRFETPLSGRYRVGVDYPDRCDASGATGFEERAAYAISVLHAGKRQNVEGTVGYHFFEIAALDFDIGATDATAGQILFEQHCVSCHGASGDGKGPATQDMDRNPRSFVTAEFKFDTDADWQRGTDADIANVIRLGATAYGGSPLMPPWGQVLSDEDIVDLVAYIRSLETQ